MLLVAISGLVACPTRPGFEVPDVPGDGPGRCAPGAVSCTGNAASTCGPDGVFGGPTACGDQRCVPDLGCRTCEPGTTTCGDDGRVMRCNPDGNGQTAQAPCNATSVCNAGACTELCALARTQNSYLGCDYWPTTTLNSALGSHSSDPFDNAGPPTGVAGFPFAIAVANPQRVPAEVRVSGGALTADLTVTVDPGAVQTIRLPWVQLVSQVTQRGAARLAGTSAFAVGGAYHVVTSVPVTIYQFNPLSYRDVNRTNCDPRIDVDCFAYTNDASLLLPTHVLTGNYTVLSWPTQGTQATTGGFSSSSGFIAIVGTAPGTTTVSVHTTASVRTGTLVAPLSPDDTETYDLEQGDVLLLASGTITSAAACNVDPVPRAGDGARVCRPNRQLDLTGSIIEANHPVAVFGGHNCAMIPYNHFACDHIEEQLFPNETLGNHYFVARTTPQHRGTPEPNVVRILSNRDSNMVTFSPANVHVPVMLDRGEFVEFEHQADFEVEGSGPFAVAQYLVGQDYFDDSSPFGPVGVGDPDMVLEVPVAQWRTSYSFLTPESYTSSFVNVVAQHGADILIDGRGLGVTPTRVGGFDIYRIDLSTSTGAHRIGCINGMTFSIKVYGFGSYTSYMYPGGLDLAPISPPG
jgi:hypothetical protein